MAPRSCSPYVRACRATREADMVTTFVTTCGMPRSTGEHSKNSASQKDIGMTGPSWLALCTLFLDSTARWEGESSCLAHSPRTREDAASAAAALFRCFRWAHYRCASVAAGHTRATGQTTA